MYSEQPKKLGSPGIDTGCSCTQDTQIQENETPQPALLRQTADRPPNTPGFASYVRNLKHPRKLTLELGALSWVLSPVLTVFRHHTCYMHTKHSPPFVDTLHNIKTLVLTLLSLAGLGAPIDRLIRSSPNLVRSYLAGPTLISLFFSLGYIFSPNPRGKTKKKKTRTKHQKESAHRKSPLTPSRIQVNKKKRRNRQERQTRHTHTRHKYMQEGGREREGMPKGGKRER